MRWLADNEMEIIRQEEVMTKFKIKSRHFSGSREENHEKPQSGQPV
jgi:hypothetical protein